MDAAGLSAFWDSAIDDFLSGGESVPSTVRPWAGSYSGQGQGVVNWDAFPEPYIGDIGRAPRMVFLGLNPGPPDLSFQGRGGVFADEIRKVGSYTSWAATQPYLREPWRANHRSNPYHDARLRFMRRWFEDDAVNASQMLTFELYPWHSNRVTALMLPDAATAREYVLEPIATTGARTVFAFGAPWFRVLPSLGAEEVAKFGRGGQAFGSHVPSRSVAVYRLASLMVVCEKHSGSAGPPRAEEVRVLRQALASWAAISDAH